MSITKTHSFGIRGSGFGVHEAVFTLFGWMLGDFDIDVVRPEGVLGALFLGAFLSISLILLLNLLIALFSATYASHDKVSKGLHFR